MPRRPRRTTRPRTAVQSRLHARTRRPLRGRVHRRASCPRSRRQSAPHRARPLLQRRSRGLSRHRGAVFPCGRPPHRGAALRPAVSRGPRARGTRRPPSSSSRLPRTHRMRRGRTRSRPEVWKIAQRNRLDEPMRECAERICKPEVTGSIPVRSIEKGPARRGFSFSDSGTADTLRSASGQLVGQLQSCRTRSQQASSVPSRALRHRGRAVRSARSRRPGYS